MTQVPNWGTAVVNNYRSLFLKLQGHEWRGTDEELWAIIQSVGTASTGEEQDAWIIDEMVNLEE